MYQTSFHIARTLGLAAILTLSACNGADAPVEVEIEDPASVAIELGDTGLSVADPRLVMAPVATNPAAVYFELSNAGEESAAISGVEIKGAYQSMLHTTEKSDGAATMKEMDSVEIPAGDTVSFAPGGNHVMAFDVSPAIGPGSKVDVTLKLANGEEATFKADVRAAGDER